MTEVKDSGRMTWFVINVGTVLSRLRSFIIWSKTKRMTFRMRPMSTECLVRVLENSWSSWRITHTSIYSKNAGMHSGSVEETGSDQRAASDSDTSLGQDRAPRMQFSTDEASNFRKVTLLRWNVEAVNGRVKNTFHYSTNAFRISLWSQIAMKS